MQPAHPYRRAATLALAAYSLWAGCDVCAKIARMQGVPRGPTMLIVALSGMLVLAIIQAARGKLGQLRPQQGRGLAILGLCQVTSYACWLSAMPHLPLATMYVVNFLTPLTVACLAGFFLKEQVGLKRGLIILIGFVGVVVAIDPVGMIQSDLAWSPYLSAFGSTLATAAQMLALRHVSQSENSACVAFYPRLAIVGAGALACASAGFPAIPLWIFLMLCLAGICGGFGWVLMSKASQSAPASVVTPFHYSQMISGGLFGYLIWGDVPMLHLLGGTAIIIASGIYLVRHEQRVGARSMVALAE